MCVNFSIAEDCTAKHSFLHASAVRTRSVSPSRLEVWDQYDGEDWLVYRATQQTRETDKFRGENRAQREGRASR